jgi:hypothetical protein
MDKINNKSRKRIKIRIKTMIQVDFKMIAISDSSCTYNNNTNTLKRIEIISNNLKIYYIIFRILTLSKLKLINCIINSRTEILIKTFKGPLNKNNQVKQGIFFKIQEDVALNYLKYHHLKCLHFKLFNKNLIEL